MQRRHPKDQRASAPPNDRTPRRNWTPRKQRNLAADWWRSSSDGPAIGDASQSPPNRKESEQSNSTQRGDSMANSKPLPNPPRLGETSNGSPPHNESESIDLTQGSSAQAPNTLELGCMYWLKHQGDDGCFFTGYERRVNTDRKAILDDRVCGHVVMLLSSFLAKDKTFYTAALLTTFKRMSYANWNTARSISENINLRKSIPLASHSPCLSDSSNIPATPVIHLGPRNTHDTTLHLLRGSLDRDCYARIDRILELPGESLRLYCYEGGILPPQPPKLCFKSYAHLMGRLHMKGDMEELYFAGNAPYDQQCEDSVHVESSNTAAAVNQDANDRGTDSDQARPSETTPTTAL